MNIKTNTGSNTVINTVITIDLKEYARLQALEQVASDYKARAGHSILCLAQVNENCTCGYDRLCELLDGEK